MMIRHVSVRHVRREYYRVADQNVVQRSRNVRHIMIHVIVQRVKTVTK